MNFYHVTLIRLLSALKFGLDYDNCLKVTRDEFFKKNSKKRTSEIILRNFLVCSSFLQMMSYFGDRLCMVEE
ncbi:MAG: hypothetical protein CMM67_02255 [Rhodospirillaceae bacterium]|nr:hypothetical protein [Rhodospirillaceae bacterium]OUT80332.1 MAG: hypothetical protein CBB83_02060 [Rhodospirillaceae bacterium TMED23]